MKDSAIILTAGMFNGRNAKTAFGLIRKSERYEILAVIDKVAAGEDAGEFVHGKNLGIPILSSIKDFKDYYCSNLDKDSKLSLKGIYAIIGIATSGGEISKELRFELIEALTYGMHIVNGLHSYLLDDSEILQKAKKNRSKLLDIRRPKNVKDQKFWTGEITKVKAPRIALLGTDCNLGKRTSGIWLKEVCCENGIRTEMIYTGQTGKLQGGNYGFILDSTLNDFVSGELESSIIDCDKSANPDLILLEGQSSLRNPSGPCGSEFLCSAMAKGVILQYSPKQKYFLADYDRKIFPIPPIEEELELIRLYGAQTLAITLNSQNLSKNELYSEQKKIENLLGIPVLCPKEDGMKKILPIVREYLKSQS
tara:strand:+ start:172 stop:1269 length:1098 start_codon:yes stop_codon:yes gene_type:complete